MVGRLDGTKPLSEQVLEYYSFDPWEQTWNFNQNSNILIQENAFESVVCKMASICLCLNVLKNWDN